ncbi:hypothetical protein FOZ63_015555, partial [Perkinsus olseni]
AKQCSLMKRLKVLDGLEDKHKRHLREIQEFQKILREDAIGLSKRLEGIQKEAIELRREGPAGTMRSAGIDGDVKCLEDHSELRHSLPPVEEDACRNIAVPLLREIYSRVCPLQRNRSLDGAPPSAVGASRSSASVESSRRRAFLGSVHGEVDPEILERIARLNQWFNTNSSKWGHSGRRNCHDVKAVVLMTPRGALRKVLETRCGGLKKAYHHLDSNGNGQLSRGEFEGALKALGVPWEDVTGERDFPALCRLLGEKEGEVMLSEVLG